MNKNDFIKAVWRGVKIAMSIVFGIPATIALITAWFCTAISGCFDSRFMDFVVNKINKFIDNLNRKIDVS